MALSECRGFDGVLHCGVEAPSSESSVRLGYHVEDCLVEIVHGILDGVDLVECSLRHVSHDSGGRAWDGVYCQDLR